MKIQEDNKLGDWFEEWYKKLVQQRLGAIYVTQANDDDWMQSALDLMNKMLTRIQQLEGQNG